MAGNATGLKNVGRDPREGGIGVGDHIAHRHTHLRRGGLIARRIAGPGCDLSSAVRNQS